MRVEITKAELQKILKRITISKNAVHPVTQNVLITAGQTVVFVATDLQTSIRQETDNAEVKQEGIISLNAKTFGAAINSLPSGTIKIEQKEDYKVEISGEYGNFNLITGETSDFPTIDFELKNPEFVSIDDLLFLINKTAFSVSKDISRPNLTGINFENIDGKSIAVSTDGFRISVAEKQSSLKEVESFLLPLKAVNEIKNLLQEFKQEETVSCSFNNQEKSTPSKIWFKFKDVAVVVQLSFNKFPDWRKIIPESEGSKIKIEVGKLKSAVKMMEVVSNAGMPVVKFRGKNKILNLSSENSDVGAADVDLAIEYKSQFRFSVSCKYLFEILNVVDQDFIDIYLQDDPKKAILIKAGEELIYLIMPLIEDQEETTDK